MFYNCFSSNSFFSKTCTSLLESILSNMSPYLTLSSNSLILSTLPALNFYNLSFSASICFRSELNDSLDFIADESYC